MFMIMFLFRHLNAVDLVGGFSIEWVDRWGTYNKITIGNTVLVTLGEIFVSICNVWVI